MKEKNIVRYKLSELPKGKTNWERVRKMTEKEINERAISDLNAQPLTEKELSKFKKVFPPKKIDVKKIRTNLHLSQDKFANYFGISKRTLQQWEQGRSKPRRAARILLTVIKYDPTAIQRAFFHIRH